MIKEIVKDEEFLSQPAEPATAEDAAVAQDLVDTMLSMHDDCACLAANQIGVNKAIIAFDDGDKGKISVMYNPRIKNAMKPYGALEGCLSLDRETPAKRYELIMVAYEVLVDGKLVAKTRKLTGWTAEIVQHAIDHTKGILV